jgi:hypothetical protein
VSYHVSRAAVELERRELSTLLRSPTGHTDALWVILAGVFVLGIAARLWLAQPVYPCVTPATLVSRPLPQAERSVPNVARGGVGQEMPAGGIPAKEVLP